MSQQSISKTTPEAEPKAASESSCEETLQELSALFQAQAYEELLSQCENLLTPDLSPELAAQKLAAQKLSPMDTFRILDMQQKALRVTDRLDEALHVAEKQLAILLEHFPEKLLYTAQILQNTALLHTQLENFPDAIHNANQAIDIFRENPEYEEHLASALCIISSAHYHARDLINAEKTLFQALAIWQKKDEDPRHFQASTCYNNLGRIYEHQGQHDKAISYHTKAVTLRKELLGEHPETAFCLGNLGTAHASMGEWHKASLSLQEAIHIYANVGMRDSGIARAYQANLDIALQALNDEK